MATEFKTSIRMEWSKDNVSVVVQQNPDGDVCISKEYLGVRSESNTVILDEEEWQAMYDMLGELE